MARESSILSKVSVEGEHGTPTTQGLSAKKRSARLRFVRIHFPDKKSRVAGVYRLMRKTRVVCLPNDEFVISKAGLSILKDSAIHHEVLGEASLDETLAALRDSAAPLL